MVAAAAAPYVISALQKKPKKPGAPSPVTLPDRSKYIQDLIDASTRPNEGAYRMASDVSVDNVNRILGKQGLGGSSVGLGVHASAQANLANKFMENELNRRINALNVAANYDRMNADVQMGNSGAAYKYATDMFNLKNKENAGQVQGISSLINAGLGAYQQGQASNRWDEIMELNRQHVNQMNINSQTAPQYGAPGPQVGMQPAPSPYNPGFTYANTGGMYAVPYTGY